MYADDTALCCIIDGHTSRTMINATLKRLSAGISKQTVTKCG